jgi:hypothetical protein
VGVPQVTLAVSFPVVCITIAVISLLSSLLGSIAGIWICSRHWQCPIQKRHQVEGWIKEISERAARARRETAAKLEDMELEDQSKTRQSL